MPACSSASCCVPRFLTDYFVNEGFRRELRRVLNRGEAVNALERAIYSGRVNPMQARRSDDMQAVADALSLLANIVMTWNTSRMQAVLDGRQAPRLVLSTHGKQHDHEPRLSTRRSSRRPYFAAAARAAPTNPSVSRGGNGPCRFGKGSRGTISVPLNLLLQ